eukprot:TRINITY_DN10228_c0_g4_i1.p1 TRINITY_DN10228_c0_g4~~TRINITY_DN10228_c0_g4_i1.p1  ORF type:complete len:281 (+),score=35.57 TRINITY_DN10228_c0_g4_i1:53-844(+)
MALAQELDPKDTTGNLSEESTGQAFGELIRDYQPNPGTVWRFGKPNYARVNKTYFEHRTIEHESGSLEAVVSKIVKNWEVESHHIADIHQWKTMDISKFKAGLNGGCPCSAQKMAEIGPYNMLLGETSSYSARSHSFSSSNKVFSETFPEGFAWECLEVYSGPPSVLFKWRHFGKYSGTFTDKNMRQYKGNGKMFSLIGMCVAKVTASGQIAALDVYYNPEDMLSPLTSTMVDPTWRANNPDDVVEGAGLLRECKSGPSCACM